MGKWISFQATPDPLFLAICNKIAQTSKIVGRKHHVGKLYVTIFPIYLVPPGEPSGSLSQGVSITGVPCLPDVRANANRSEISAFTEMLGLLRLYYLVIFEYGSYIYSFFLAEFHRETVIHIQRI